VYAARRDNVPRCAAQYMAPAAGRWGCHDAVACLGRGHRLPSVQLLKVRESAPSSIKNDFYFCAKAILVCPKVDEQTYFDMTHAYV